MQAGGITHVETLSCVADVPGSCGGGFPSSAQLTAFERQSRRPRPTAPRHAALLRSFERNEAIGPHASRRRRRRGKRVFPAPDILSLSENLREDLMTFGAAGGCRGLRLRIGAALRRAVWGGRGRQGPATGHGGPEHLRAGLQVRPKGLTPPHTASGQVQAPRPGPSSFTWSKLFYCSVPQFPPLSD